MSMCNILVSRYADPASHGWAGAIEPADRTWIAFIGLDGRPVFYLNRDPVTGAVLPDDATEREKHLATLRERRALHTGVTLTPEDVKQEGVRGQPGEIVIPLGISGNGGRDV